LTGDVSEQCFFVLHGNGSNGKTTFLNILKHIIGDYALTAQQALLLQDERNRSNGEDEANLFGIRMACCSETNEGQRFDESKVKRLTGSSCIRARRLYENSFEFDPTYKIWLDCNHLPHIRSTDQGIWRRVKRIPFLVAIPEHERDTKLEAKLKAEASGILNWMLQGLTQWREHGLKEPAEVCAAVNEYRSDNDALGRFLCDCATNNCAEQVEASKLYGAYKRWCGENGLDHPLSQIALGKKLKERNYQPVRSTGGQRYWMGLALKDVEADDDPFVPGSSPPDARSF
jgi:putative DNA primase/helicase